MLSRNANCYINGEEVAEVEYIVEVSPAVFCELPQMLIQIDFPGFQIFFSSLSPVHQGLESNGATHANDE